MYVKEIMTANVETVHPEASLAEAGVAMLRGDCGALPVIDGNGVVIGVITDRDICIALALRGMIAPDIQVGTVASTRLFYARPGDTLHQAMELMRREQVRRLPVIDDEHHLAGMLSISDIINVSEPAARTRAAVAAIDVIATLKAIGKHWRPQAEEQLSSVRRRAGHVEEPHDFDFEE